MPPFREREGRGITLPQIGSPQRRPIGFVSYKDVAEIAVRSLALEASKNKTISLAGPANVAPLDVVQAFERASGRRFAVEHVPEEALLEKYRGAVNPLEKDLRRPHA